MSNESAHKLTYRGVELSIAVESFIASSSIAISRAFLQGIDAALDAREALVAEMDAKDKGYEELAEPEYEYYRDGLDPANVWNYYHRVDINTLTNTVVRGRGTARVSSTGWTREELRNERTFTPLPLVPDWAKEG